MEDSLWAGLTDSHVGLPMGMTAENLAVKVRHIRSYKCAQACQCTGTTVSACDSVAHDMNRWRANLFPIAVSLFGSVGDSSMSACDSCSCGTSAVRPLLWFTSESTLTCIRKLHVFLLDLAFESEVLSVAIFIAMHIGHCSFAILYT